MGPWKSSGWLHCVAAAAMMCAGSAFAQDPRLQQLGKPSGNFGMDKLTFERHFSGAFRPSRKDAQEPATVEALADNVVELRLFLTDQRDVVRGEMAIDGKTRLRQVTLDLEGGPVRFNRTAEGVFSAEFRMDTARAWYVARKELQGSARALRAAEARTFVQLGPRNLVPVRAGLESLSRTSPDAVRVLGDDARLQQLLGESDPARAAGRAGIDPRRTPFLVVPGPRARPDAFRRAFDIPIIPFFPMPAPPVPVDESRSLMVIDTGVVEDPSRTFDVCTNAGTPSGPWTFGHLMRELSFGTGMSAEDFAMHWLSTWILPQEANGWIVDEPSRAAALQAVVIDGWQRASGATLDIEKFPARLLAIVNRPDLADKIGYGVAGTAGEGRFVFGLLNKQLGGGCSTLPFTVIFEYGIKGGSCTAVKSWHQRWKDLDANAPGSAAYNAALELITRDFTDHGSNPAQSPNHSSLNQLRTNENALNPLWQLREFRLQATGSVAPGVLDLVTVKQTPDESFRNGTSGTPTIGAFLLAREADILADKHVVPERFPGIFDRFLGARSDTPFHPFNVFWTAPNLATLGLTNAAEARRKFSLGTCNACHGGETRTFFTHIGSVGNRPAGSPAVLSQFLTGDPLPPEVGDPPVPVTGGTHHYDDLEERRGRMSDILVKSCFGLLGVRRIPFVH